MPLSFTFDGTDVNLAADLRTKLDVLGPALVQKMTYLMAKLQQKARANASVSRVKESIRNPRAEVEGSKIIGRLTWGGEPTTVSYKGGKPYDLAQIFEYGTRVHAVNPLTTSGTRVHEFGARRRVGKNVLKMMIGGKETFARFAFPRGVKAEQYMERAIESMRMEFAQGLLDTIRGEIKKR